MQRLALRPIVHELDMKMRTHMGTSSGTKPARHLFKAAERKELEFAMMSDFSPCISCVLCLLIVAHPVFLGERQFWRQPLFGGSSPIIITEALSALGTLSYPTVLSFWLLGGAALAVLYL